MNSPSLDQDREFAQGYEAWLHEAEPFGNDYDDDNPRKPYEDYEPDDWEDDGEYLDDLENRDRYIRQFDED